MTKAQRRHPSAANFDFDLEGKVRAVILPLASGLVLVESMHDIHMTVRGMFRAVYPIVAAARNFIGFNGRDLSEARHDAHFTIPIITLTTMEDHICSETSLPEHTRTGFRATAQMLRHRIDPTAPPPPGQKWADLWLRYFDYDIMELALPYLAQWSPSPPADRKPRKVCVSTDEIRRRDDLVVDWQRFQREEVQAGRLAWKGLRGDHKPWTIDWLCEEHGIDRGDFGRWQRGEIPSHSVKSMRIEAALTVGKGS